MIELSPEALAKRVAEASGLSLGEAVRRALEARENRASRTPRMTKLASEIVAARYAAIERAVQAMAALPDLDPRSPREIMDDLNSL